MNEFEKTLLEMPLSSGSHNRPEDGACVMEKVGILWQLNAGLQPSMNDLPDCTNVVIAKHAQLVNDSLSDADRQKLNVFIPRLLRARRTPSDNRVNVRLAIWAARSVLHLTGSLRDAAEEAIEAAEKWLEDPSKENAANATYAANAATYATYATAANAATYAAANAATYAANAATHATNAATYATAANAATYAAANAATYATYAATYATYATAANAANAAARLASLDGLLDAWEEGVTKEGEDLYVPRPWEEGALRLAEAISALPL